MTRDPYSQCPTCQAPAGARCAESCGTEELEFSAYIPGNLGGSTLTVQRVGGCAEVCLKAEFPDVRASIQLNSVTAMAFAKAVEHAGRKVGE